MKPQAAYLKLLGWCRRMGESGWIALLTIWLVCCRDEWRCSVTHTRNGSLSPGRTGSVTPRHPAVAQWPERREMVIEEEGWSRDTCWWICPGGSSSCSSYLLCLPRLEVRTVLCYQRQQTAASVWSALNTFLVVNSNSSNYCSYSLTLCDIIFILYIIWLDLIQFIIWNIFKMVGFNSTF